MEENKKKFNWKPAVIIVMAVLLIFSLAKINELENEISNLNNTIANCNNRISNMQSNIDSIYSNVDEQLKKEASLLSSVDYTLGELNKEDHTVPVTLTVIPKSLTDDMQLSAKVGNETFDFQRNGNEFSATFSVNMFLSYKEYPILNIIAGETTKTEMLESADMTTLYTRYLPNVYAYITPFDEFKDGKLEIDGTLQFDAKSTYIDSDVSITKVELITEKNKKEIARGDVTDKVAADFNHVPVQATYDAKYGDEFIIYVVAEDSLGYIHKVPAYYWHEIDENTSEAVTPVGDGADIYDKDGKLLTGGKV